MINKYQITISNNIKLKKEIRRERNQKKIKKESKLKKY